MAQVQDSTVVQAADQSWMDSAMETGTTMAVEYAPKVLLAVLTLLIGLWVIKRVVKGTRKLMHKRKIDDSLIPFLSGILGAILKIMLGLSVLGMFGVETTSFVAILAAAGLAIGMALSGTLQNFAGGVMLLIFKPFKPGDFIEAQGYKGVVSEIHIFNTIVKTGDNKTVILPNGGLSSGAMVNYSTEPQRRVDMTFGIGYNDDIDAARAVIEGLIAADDRILKDPAHFIAVAELADSSVNFVVRMWVEGGDYWGVFFNMQESVKKAFDEKSISIPYPQQDLHIHQASA